MSERVEGKDFIRKIIDEHNENGRYDYKVHTRFPPEPNGFLHIGHAKSILLNSGIAKEYKGKFNLRFDDTNPVKENIDYVEAIKKDVSWLGADWEDRLYFASDYFDKLYDFAVELIKKDKAFVDDLTSEETREYRGTLTKPGMNSPHRTRSVEENLDLFERMRNGEFENGEKTLRAKIDMAAPNINMRDPVIYRILHAHHHRTGDKWCIYPMYDYTHCLSDSLENITHSLCTLEFEDHRPLYDWYIKELNLYHPQQIEFARLNMTYTLMSKRRLLNLVEEKAVSNWDDPRMPTISGLRRRGFSASSIREFCNRIGVAKGDSLVDTALLEHCLREEQNKLSYRVMAVLNPLKVVIENWEEGKIDILQADNNPEDETAGTRDLTFGKEIYIERTDFMEDPPKKFFRLSVGKEVRLKHAYYITCTDVIKDDEGNIIELRASYDPESRTGDTPDKRRIKGTLHWVSVEHGVDCEVRLYDRLFTIEDLNKIPKKADWHDYLNPDSLEILTNSKIEPWFAENHSKFEHFQFMRHGYFTTDLDSRPEKLVFNRTVSLRDTWAKMAKKK